ncbi:ADP-ribosylglycohydrolase family protein [Sinomonas halotolerans]|uniref:ADP-ribosylglycohydrolase family protein n=1 Tax=Sinomonas halotolerans TaxID=1644133 RepID=A0ABU9X0K1_9MICC
MSTPTAASRIHGCLLGTAVAEAAALAGGTGAPAGTGVLAAAAPAGPGAAGGPDDAVRPLGAAGQLTLYTADALIEAIEWANDGVHADEAACVWLASLRWLEGQGVAAPSSAPAPQPRWLDSQEGARTPVAPRPAWIESLASGEMGTTSRPLGTAHDDGGAAAHAAPFGLVPHVPAAMVVKLSADGAALTHGAPAAVQAATAVASLAHFMVLGADARTALGSARAQIASLRTPDPDVLAALETADAAAGRGPADETAADRRAAGQTASGTRAPGQTAPGKAAPGPTAAGALGAAVAAILAAESAGASGEAHDVSFAAGVLLAAQQGSDAAAMAGGLLGTLWGREAVPEAWIARTAGMHAAEGIASRFAEVTGA